MSACTTCGQWTESPNNICNVCWFSHHAAKVDACQAAEVVCHRCEGRGFMGINSPADRSCELCDGVGHIYAHLWTPERAERRLDWIRRHAPHMLEGGT